MSNNILDHHLHRLLDSRVAPKTICPSEVARALSPSELNDLGVSEWRDLMPRIRNIIWSLREDGKVEILQHGEVLSDLQSLDDIKGPIRARKT